MKRLIFFLWVLYFFLPANCTSQSQFQWLVSGGQGGILYMTKTSDGGYVAGNSANSTSFFAKINSVGILQWTTRFINTDIYVKSIAQCTDGTIAIAGFKGGFSQFDMSLTKLDINGNIQWS